MVRDRLTSSNPTPTGVSAHVTPSSEIGNTIPLLRSSQLHLGLPQPERGGVLGAPGEVGAGGGAGTVGVNAGPIPSACVIILTAGIIAFSKTPAALVSVRDTDAVTGNPTEREPPYPTGFLNVELGVPAGVKEADPPSERVVPIGAATSTFTKGPLKFPILPNTTPPDTPAPAFTPVAIPVVLGITVTVYSIDRPARALSSPLVWVHACAAQAGGRGHARGA